MKEADAKRLARVEIIRQKNNVLWMGILALALDRAPLDTKEILQEIYDNDSLVAGYLKEIADD